jgi:hypothetical protein
MNNRVLNLLLFGILLGTFTEAEATPPPVRTPFVCTMTLCVEVIGYSPIATTSLTGYGGPITVQLEDGTAISFKAILLIDRYAAKNRNRVQRAIRQSQISWSPVSDSVAVSIHCIGCADETTFTPMIVAVAISAKPSIIANDLQGASICFWEAKYGWSRPAELLHERVDLSQKQCVTRTSDDT